MHAAAQPSKVLVIDDSSLARNITQGALEDAGFTVVTAADGLEGLGRLADFRPDVVVCDMMMPKMGGEEVLVEMQARAPQIPVLMFTEASNVEAAVAALRAGAFGYLPKEASAAHLVREIRAAVEHQRLVARNRHLEEEHQRYEQHLEKLVQEKAEEIVRQAKQHTATMMQMDRLAAVGTLAAGVAHEINNPLAYIGSNLRHIEGELTAFAPGTVLDAETLSEWQAALAETRQGVGQVNQIVRDLKGLSRQDDHRVPVDLRAVLESTSRMVAQTVRQRARLALEIADLPIVSGNAGKLGQVVLNLLVNASQAIPEGRVSENKVTLRAWAAAGRAIIQVTDTGAGMGEEVLARIFEPFFTTKPEGVGTGLGLSICRTIVESHGGTICVESAPGNGTSFRVELPAAA